MEAHSAVSREQILDFYTRPAAMTSGGGHAPLFDELPRDVAALAGVVQGLLLHQHWASVYGVELSDERRGEPHIRSTARMLDRLLGHDGQPLSVARPVSTRLVGNCRHLLPWDDWGAMVGPDEPLDDDKLVFLDRLAALTRAPDASFSELRALYEGDERLRVPATVFNAVLDRPEAV